MTRAYTAAVAFLAMGVGLTGCASSVEQGPESAVRLNTAPVPPADQTRAAEASRDWPAATRGEANLAALPDSRSSEMMSGPSIWDDPSFRRRFEESYLAESDVEPKLDKDELEDMLEVRQLLEARNLAGAARLLERKRGPKASAVFDFTLGNIHFEEQRWDEAEEAYRTATAKYGKFLRAHKNLGMVYARQGKFAQSIRPFTRVIELGGADSVTYGLLGFAYSSVENEIAAESAYRMAILLDPDTADWKMGLARSFFKQERFAEAASFLGTMITEEPDRADLWLLQANAYIGMEQPLRAAENYELVDQLGDSTIDSLNMLADIYINEELYDLAVESYVRALELDPQAPADRAMQAAKILVRRAAYDQTESLVEQLRSLRSGRLADDEQKDLLRLQARIAVARGAGDEEAELLKEIVRIDPLDGEALILLGQHAGRTGDTEQAVFYYERAASVPEFEPDAKVQHAQLLARHGRYAEALPLLRRAQQLEPRDNVQDYLEQVERLAKQ